MAVARYIDPFTDFGFKKLFGEEINKDLLIDFLNELLKGKEKIKDLWYKNNEQLGSTLFSREAVYDIYCENKHGEKFIVEMQKAKQDFFKDRSVFYSTFPIQEQASKGAWDFELKAVYLVGILDFVFNDDLGEPDKYLYEIKLMDTEAKTVFYEKLTYYYIEMPKFKKDESQLKTKFEKWIYFLKSLPQLDNRPKALQERIFERAFKAAEIAKYDAQEQRNYQRSLKAYRDLKNTMDTAIRDGLKEGMKEGIEKGIEVGMEKGIEVGKGIGREAGIKEGIEKGKAETAKELALAMIKEGLSASVISKITGLDLEIIQEICKQ